MLHPLPNLAVSPLYPIAWIVVVLWLGLVSVLMIRGYRERKAREARRNRSRRSSRLQTD